MARPWTDAQFVVVRGPAPRRWDPMRGLSAGQRIVLVVFTGAVLWGLGLTVEPAASRLTDWLFALGRVAAAHA